MTIRIFDDYEDLSAQAAQFMVEIIRNKPDAVICVPSGDTPKGVFREFAAIVRRENLDISGVTLIGLDEWVGIPPDNPGSCGNFIKTYLVDDLPFDKTRCHFFDGMSADLAGECEKMDQIIKTAGGLDCIVVGIGTNGHIGLNEPGVSPDLYAHVMELSEETRQTGQKYFEKKAVLTKGITLGLRHVLEAGSALLIANGEKKAAAIRHTIEGPITMDVPSTILHKHSNAFVLIDKAAASVL